jgi:caa(3)-type oxidase subunit IV
MSANTANPYRVYLTTWIALLIVTVSMLAAEKFHMPRWFLVVFLLAFMMLKAVMIGGNFMHLRHEHSRIAVMVAVGILLTSLILFGFLRPEAANVLAKTPR